MSENLQYGLILVAVIFAMMVIPCVIISVIGYRMISAVGNYPSKTPGIQMGILLKLLIVEIVALTMWLIFYHTFADYGG